MGADYSKFRTPFYEVSIANSVGKNLTRLPMQIERLIEKIEFTETICCSSFNQITITFIEGSREPFTLTNGSFADPTLYATDGESSALSNTSGMLTDLRFSKSGGVTALLGNLTKFISGGALSGVLAFLTSFGKDNTPPAPVFDFQPLGTPETLAYLFQERNQVQIKFGYK